MSLKIIQNVYGQNSTKSIHISKNVPTLKKVHGRLSRDRVVTATTPSSDGVNNAHILLIQDEVNDQKHSQNDQDADESDDPFRKFRLRFLSNRR